MSGTRHFWTAVASRSRVPRRFCERREGPFFVDLVSVRRCGASNGRSLCCRSRPSIPSRRSDYLHRLSTKIAPGNRHCRDNVNVSSPAPSVGSVRSKLLNAFASQPERPFTLSSFAQRLRILFSPAAIMLERAAPAPRCFVAHQVRAVGTEMSNRCRDLRVTRAILASWADGAMTALGPHTRPSPWLPRFPSWATLRR